MRSSVAKSFVSTSYLRQRFCEFIFGAVRKHAADELLTLALKGDLA